ncbi:MAG: U32 family peptidase [Candidatus Riflebacteria bacterium]|nr:U32 family peptidase [Candidatus Riflebacteria bacterium]
MINKTPIGNRKPRKPELMAPAGTKACLMAALQAGADAVYFGVGTFNMRSKAGNFSIQELDEVVQIVHFAGAKAYLTLNTLILPQEEEPLHRTIEAAAKAKVDAVIAWDFSVIVAARAAGLEVFISTQMSVANATAILYFHHNLGIRRFVLARECSLSNISSIRHSLVQEMGEKASEIEIEVFAHGAMCLSVSGRCQLSQFMSGKSANRGACQQPCRGTYTITETHDGKILQVGDDFTLSPKDLCTLPFLDQLLSAGVDSLKIEGRQRSIEYVSYVTKSYRRILDICYETSHLPDFSERLAEAKKEEMICLRQVFNRGFSSGFCFGKPINEWSLGDGNQATHRKQFIGEVVNYYKKSAVVAIRLDNSGISIGDEIMVHGSTTGCKQSEVTSIEDNLQPVSHGKKGRTVGVFFPELVRCGDKVYRLIPVSAKT